MPGKANINWDMFRQKNEDANTVFEKKLVLRYFCAEYGIDSADLACPDGFPGIECEPIDIGGKYYGFQAKYSRNHTTPWAKFKESIKVAIEKKREGKYQLDQVIFYTNGNAGTPNSRSEIEKLATKASIEVKWRFGEQIIEKLETSDSQAFQKLKLLFFDLSEQPPLLNPAVAEASGFVRFHYSAEQIPFAGRSTELSRLKQFVSDRESFRWWVMLGSSGTGKSRLLLEFCKKLNDKWARGWWTKDRSFDFDTWTPDRPHLLIIDYVIGREEEIGRLFDSILTRQQAGGLLNPVRIILLERFSGDWLIQLKTRGTTGPQLQNFLFADPLPELLPYKDFELNDLAQHILALVGKPDTPAETLLQLTRKADPQCRPLFMWLIAESMGEGTPQTDTTTILRECIRTERNKRWVPAGIQRDEELLLTLTIICSGVVLHSNSFQSDEARNIFAQANPDRIAFMTGRAPDRSVLHPLEPDLIGEIFALDQLKGITPLDRSCFDEATSIACRVGYGSGVVSFLMKAARDFPHHEVFEYLLEPFPERRTWALFVANSIKTLTFANPDLGKRLYRSFTALSKTPDVGIPRQIEHVVTFSFLEGLAPNGQLFDWVKSTEFLPLDEKTVQLNVIRSSPSRPSASSTSGQLIFPFPEETIKQAVDLWMSVLTEDFRSGCFTQTMCWLCRLRLLSQLQGRNDIKVIVSFYNEILRCCETNRTDLDVISSFGSIASDLIVGLHQFSITQRHPDDARILAMKCFEDALKLFGGDSKIPAELYGNMLPTLVMYCNREVAEGDRPLAWEYIERLRNRISKTDASDKLTLQRALAAAFVNISHVTNSQAEYDEVRKLEREIRDFTLSANDPKCLESHAMGMGNIVSHNPKSSTLEHERELMETWVCVAKSVDYPAEANRYLVKTADLKFQNTLNSSLKNASKEDIPKYWYAQLKQAVLMNANNNEACRTFSSALVSAYKSAKDAGDTDFAKFCATEYVEHAAMFQEGELFSFWALLYGEACQQANTERDNLDAIAILNALIERSPENSKLRSLKKDIPASRIRG